MDDREFSRELFPHLLSINSFPTKTNLNDWAGTQSVTNVEIMAPNDSECWQHNEGSEREGHTEKGSHARLLSLFLNEFSYWDNAAL